MTDSVSSVRIRVRYAETDQMGFAHHSNHVIWCEAARTHYMRERGVSYRELEQQGLLLAVTDLNIRYRSSARFDDVLKVICWVRDVQSRKVRFGYAIERESDATLIATAQTSLIALNSEHALARIPQSIRNHLVPVGDPVRL